MSVHRGRPAARMARASRCRASTSFRRSPGCSGSRPRPGFPARICAPRTSRDPRSRRRGGASCPTGDGRRWSRYARSAGSDRGAGARPPELLRPGAGSGETDAWRDRGDAAGLKPRSKRGRHLACRRPRSPGAIPRSTGSCAPWAVE
jgi:hypothetical protein